MSLEQVIEKNTEALIRVGDLLEQSNAGREEVLTKMGANSTPTPTPSTSPSATEVPSVEEIKEAVKTADSPTLAKMLEDETNGKARKTALAAIEGAIGANATAGDEAAEQAVETETKEVTPAAEKSAAASTEDKNAQPVPANVTGEQVSKTIGAWFGETDDEGERAKRRAFVEQVVKKFGKRVGEFDTQQARQAVFYLRRHRAGIEVDFDGSYDFEGSPTQETSAASADDPLL